MNYTTPTFMLLAATTAGGIVYYDLVTPDPDQASDSVLQHVANTVAPDYSVLPSGYLLKECASPAPLPPEAKNVPVPDGFCLVADPGAPPASQGPTDNPLIAANGDPYTWLGAVGNVALGEVQNVALGVVGDELTKVFSGPFGPEVAGRLSGLTGEVIGSLMYGGDFFDAVLAATKGAAKQWALDKISESPTGAALVTGYQAFETTRAVVGFLDACLSHGPNCVGGFPTIVRELETLYNVWDKILPEQGQEQIEVAGTTTSVSMLEDPFVKTALTTFDVFQAAVLAKELHEAGFLNEPCKNTTCLMEIAMFDESAKQAAEVLDRDEVRRLHDQCREPSCGNFYRWLARSYNGTNLAKTTPSSAVPTRTPPSSRDYVDSLTIRAGIDFAVSRELDTLLMFRRHYAGRLCTGDCGDGTGLLYEQPYDNLDFVEQRTYENISESWSGRTPPTVSLVSTCPPRSVCAQAYSTTAFVEPYTHTGIILYITDEKGNTAKYIVSGNEAAGYLYPEFGKKPKARLRIGVTKFPFDRYPHFDHSSQMIDQSGIYKIDNMTAKDVLDLLELYAIAVGEASLDYSLNPQLSPTDDDANSNSVARDLLDLLNIPYDPPDIANAPGFTESIGECCIRELRACAKTESDAEYVYEWRTCEEAGSR